MWFEIAPGQTRDTGVLKIVLAPSATRLDALEQPPILGYDGGTPNVYGYLHQERGGTRGAAASHDTPPDDSWDTLTRFVTVHANGPAPPQ
jgi:hypothetical protein